MLSEPLDYRSLTMLRDRAAIDILTIGNCSEKEAINDGTLVVEIEGGLYR